MALDYTTNLSLHVLDDYQKAIKASFIQETIFGTRIKVVASDKGLRKPGPGQTMLGKKFVLTQRRGPYVAGGSMHRGTSDRFPKTFNLDAIETDWYLTRCTIPWEVDRHTKALTGAKAVSKDFLTALERCTGHMTEAALQLAEEFVWKGGNGVLATVSAIETKSVTEYTGWLITLSTTTEKWPNQWFPPGSHFCVQDASDVAGAGSLLTPPAGLVVYEQIGKNQIGCALYTTGDIWPDAGAYSDITSGDFIKRHIGQDATAAGSSTGMVDGYRRKTSPWGVPDIVFDSDPTTYIDNAAVYVGGTSRSAQNLLKAQVEYGTSRGMPEALTWERLSDARRLCKSRNGDPRAIWCGPETGREMVKIEASKGQIDWSKAMAAGRMDAGNVLIANITIDGVKHEVVIGEKAPSYKAYMLDESSLLFKMTEEGWYYVLGPGGDPFVHMYPTRDTHAALVAVDPELSCDNMPGNCVIEDIKHT